jgi:putative endopeptidase
MKIKTIAYTLLAITCTSVLAQPPFTGKWMDTSISPGENFYLFANGQWLKDNPIPNDYPRWSVFEKVNKEVEDEVYEMIEHLPNNQKAFRKKINQQLYQFYQSGMDEKQIEENKDKPLKKNIDAIQALKSYTDLPRILALLRSIGVNAFFDFSNFNDLHRKDFVIGDIGQSGLNLPDRNYYIRGDKNTLAVQKAYKKLLLQFFKNLGEDDKTAAASVANVWQIEHQLAIFAKDRSFFRVPKNIDHLSSSTVIIKAYPNMGLETYFKSIGFDTDIPINISSKEYMAKLNDYLPTLQAKAIQDYLLAHLILSYASYMNSAYTIPKCHFVKILSGIKECPVRWKRVIQTLDDELPFEVGDLYVENYATGKEKEMVQMLINNISQTLKEKIMKANWLTSKTKDKALQKLVKMKARVGYPEKSFDYSTLGVKSQSYAENVMAAERFEQQRQDKKINHPLDTSEWYMSPQSVNAYYDVTKNEINIPLGILKPPFFDEKAAPSANYAGIGMVIGHEISHGFDDEGAQFDENGQLNFWWDKIEWTNYQKKLNCIVTQFSNYNIPETNLKVNGQLVSGEAIADNTGMNLAYDAFRKTDYFNQKGLKFSPSQEFYINFAHLWAGNIRKENSMMRAHTDPHPPMSLRVNGTLENMPEFYKAFGLRLPKNTNDICGIF